MIEKNDVPVVVRQIFADICAAGGCALLVGGAVRDLLLGQEPKDFDCEVHGIAPFVWLPILDQYGHVEERGLQKFPTYGLVVEGFDFEFAPPRRDSKTGPKHTDFEIEIIPDLSLTDSCARRNFTINSMAYDPIEGLLYDPFNGEQDVVNHILRCTDYRTFLDDPLRPLIGMQMCGRYQLTVEPQSAIMIAHMSPSFATLTTHAQWSEWEKWALKSTRPSMGLRYLRDVSWIAQYPALFNLIGVEQDKTWHPEGDAWEHTCHVVDVASYVISQSGITHKETHLTLMFAALLHDVGKVSTTVRGDDGRIRSIGHEKAGVPIAKAFLEQIGAPLDVIANVLPLIAEHMNWKGGMSSIKAMRRLASRLQPADVKMLAAIVLFDHAGRPPLDPIETMEKMEIFTEMAETAGVLNGIPQIVYGRHLIERGWTPGPQMGRKLKELQALWIAGKWSMLEEGLKLVKELRPIFEGEPDGYVGAVA